MNQNKIIINKAKAQELAKSHGFKLIQFPDEWSVFYKKPVTFKCNICGGEFDRTVAEFKRNQQCFQCAKNLRQKNFRTNRRLELMEIMERTLRHHPGSEIVGGIESIQGLPEERATIICENGHHFNSVIRRMKICLVPGTNYSQWCRQCNTNTNDHKQTTRETPEYQRSIDARKNPKHINYSKEEMFDRLKYSALECGLKVNATEWKGIHHQYIFSCLICGKTILRSARGLFYDLNNWHKTTCINGYCSYECKRKFSNQKNKAQYGIDYFDKSTKRVDMAVL